MDVDGAAGELAAQVVGEDLHVARQHHQFRAFRLDDLQLPGFALRLARGSHRDMVERNVVAGGKLVELAMVGDDRPDVQRQQAGLPAEQQVVQAMPLLADQDDGAHRLRRRVQLPHHPERFGEDLQLGVEVVAGELAAGKLHTHEEQPGAVVVVLRGFLDVAAAFEQKAGNCVHDARPVGAGEGEDVSRVHTR